MNLLYNIAISAYKLCVNIVAHRNEKAKKMLAGQSQTFKIIQDKIDPNERYIWIHASSLGEFEQGRPFIELIKRNNPQQKIILTFFSPSGYEVRKNYTEADIICYLPFDLPGNVTRFLDLVNPEMAVFIKYEFWGNYLEQLYKRDIPTYLISAIFRPTQLFFKPYGGMFRNMLKCYTAIFVQDEESSKLLSSIGIHNMKITGDTRFDRVTDILSICKKLPLVENFSKNSTFTLIAGSSWQADEDIFIPFFNSHPEVKLIIVPHELSEERINSIKSHITRPTLLYSQADENSVKKADCLIIDCYGILSSCYRYANVAYIGGGFGVGIHNINEAAVYGIPVIFGPNYNKFKEAHDLIASGGGFSIDNPGDFSKLMTSFITDNEYLKTHGKVAGEYIKNNLGATKRIYNYIFPSI